MPNNPDYRPRIVDAEMNERLAAVATVVIKGTQACDKTAAAQAGDQRVG